MQRISTILALAATLLIPAELVAQVDTHTSVESELRSMLVVDNEASDREIVLEFLADDAVADVAAAESMDVGELRDRVRTMDEESASDLANRVREMKEDMVGGDTFVIGSTTLIIILLVLILLTD